MKESNEINNPEEENVGMLNAPLTPAGKTAMFRPPPWRFSMDIVAVEYYLEPGLIERYLPKELAPDPDRKGTAMVLIIDGTAVSEASPDQTVTRPAEVNHLECLIHLSCRYGEQPTWFSAHSWVTNDVSLLRGLQVCVPKRLGQISMTNFNRLGKNLAEGRHPGARIGARVQAPDGLSLYAEHTCESRADSYNVFGIPQIKKEIIGGGLMIADASEKIVEEIWEGPGRLECAAGDSDIAPLLTPSGSVWTRSFRAAFKINGMKSIEDIQ
uniref:Acetoacetate decarboxylase (ADC) n=1 Tax=Candidatus Kentrum sp. FM TaxID=2126340 RepID=A0A450SZG1_9GAMM|nr:MAG: Acetoacetate decarboxylase (ADC) [Candidatus Kentron sp. FM]VFJ59621.1 MAG: Acetoacetate decarboxylase (ADC) [Candidatus Kentron sp. FM]VFK12263.1 MAG: Acetoacetate decarboxylase (ADC) [Candidatus Kentron sp. FM]